MNRSESIINKYIDNLVLQSDPLAPKWNMENIIYNKAPKWNYVDNCMITALLMLYDLDSDPRLLDYSIKFTNAYVKKDGSIPTMNCADYNLDNINGAKNLMKLWKLTGEERYRFGFEKIWKEQLIRHPRLSCGSFWHKAIYPEQIWIDGVYMVLPFMAEYGKLYNIDVCFNSLRADNARYDLEHNLENIVYNELIYRGYKVKLFNINGHEIDFHCFPF